MTTSPASMTGAADERLVDFAVQFDALAEAIGQGGLKPPSACADSSTLAARDARAGCLRFALARRVAPGDVRQQGEAAILRERGDEVGEGRADLFTLGRNRPASCAGDSRGLPMRRAWPSAASAAGEVDFWGPPAQRPGFARQFEAAARA